MKTTVKNVLHFYIFYYNECAGLQAKAPLAPDLPTEPDQKRCEAFEYERHGTTDLMAFLNRKTGKVYGRCVLNHCTETLVDVFKGHVNTLPFNATIHYVMDNLNTHFNDYFCQSVAGLSNVTYAPLKTGNERRLWLQSEEWLLFKDLILSKNDYINEIINGEIKEKKRIKALQALDKTKVLLT